MKVVIITHIRGSFQFIDELSIQLINKNIELEVFDMIDMYSISYVNRLPETKFHLTSKLVRKLFSIRYLGFGLRYLFYKIYFLVKPIQSDHITIHYVLPYYSLFIHEFKKMSKSVSACIWGSDFYRVSNIKRRRMYPLFMHCNSIIIGNTKMSEQFSSFYDNNFSEKIVNASFGISKLELIDNLANEFTKDELKKSINLPNDKLIISIGYNGIKEQQHLLVLNQFENIPPSILTKIFIIIQFSYGGDLIYKDLIRKKLISIGVGYILFDEFLSDIDVAKIRLCTDFVINAQISDASSASLREHLYSQNVLLAGEWLPYEYFVNNGIKLWFFNENNLKSMILDIIQNFKQYSKDVKYNRDKILRLSSWKFQIDNWLNIFCNN